MGNSNYKTAATRVQEAVNKLVNAQGEYELLRTHEAGPDDRMELQNKRVAAEKRLKAAQEAWIEAKNALDEQIRAIGFPVE